MRVEGEPHTHLKAQSALSSMRNVTTALPIWFTLDMALRHELAATPPKFLTAFLRQATHTPSRGHILKNHTPHQERELGDDPAEREEEVLRLGRLVHILRLEGDYVTAQFVEREAEELLTSLASPDL